MSSYTEEHIKSAEEAVLGGMGIRQASRDWGIPHATLYGRLGGGGTRKEAKALYQRLTPTQEASLVSWVTTQGSLGVAPTHKQVNELASRIVRAGGDTRPLGRKWMEGFLRRNPVIKTLKVRAIDSKRVKDVNAAVIKDLFKIFDLLEVKDIPLSLRWNIDETGLIEGSDGDYLVLGKPQRRAVYVQASKNRVWTTILECISATGQTTPPLVIFTGQSVQQQWFPLEMSDFASWQFTASTNGWTSNAIGLEWLKKVFIPHTAAEAKRLRSKRLLVIDGHGSHVSDDFMWLCYCEQIYLACLPAHSSHVTQLLDVSIFSPLKKAFYGATRDCGLLLNSAPIGKQNFLRCYLQARNDAFITRNIRAGWLATGTYRRTQGTPVGSPVTRSTQNTITVHYHYSHQVGRPPKV
ncbi:transposase [Colletotrichum kahawae]|uniref:Transposase n=1 Tax=Colletotrichum kahawae TaxID=34407 RepID=A0AAD9YMG3_COLKA|nr:transposase [Colletotrichum kahawae]